MLSKIIVRNPQGGLQNGKSTIDRDTGEMLEQVSDNIDRLNLIRFTRVIRHGLRDHENLGPGLKLCGKTRLGVKMK